MKQEENGPDLVKMEWFLRLLDCPIFRLDMMIMSNKDSDRDKTKQEWPKYFRPPVPAAKWK